MSTQRQHGFVELISLFIVFIIALIAGYIGTSPVGNNSPSIAARNTQRANDAASLLAGTAEYMSNNNGSLPTMYKNGKLQRGEQGETPVTVSLGYYKTVTVASGKQNRLSADELWLVTGSTCDGSGGAVVGIERADAALYGKEIDADVFMGECQEG